MLTCRSDLNTQWIIIKIFLIKIMNKLCRRCGEETVGTEKCSVCHEVFKYLCPECNVIYEDFHSNCSEIEQLGKIIIK